MPDEATFVFQVPPEKPFAFELEVLVFFTEPGGSPKRWALSRIAEDNQGGLLAPYVTKFGWSKQPDYQEYIPFDGAPEGYVGIKILFELACYLVRGNWSIELDTIDKGGFPKQIRFSYTNDLPEFFSKEKLLNAVAIKSSKPDPVPRRLGWILAVCVLAFGGLGYFFYFDRSRDAEPEQSFRAVNDTAHMATSEDIIHVDLSQNDAHPKEANFVRCVARGTLPTLTALSKNSIVAVARKDIAPKSKGVWDCHFETSLGDTYISTLHVAVAPKTTLPPTPEIEKTKEQDSFIEFVNGREDKSSSFIFATDGFFKESLGKDFETNPDVISIISPLAAGFLINFETGVSLVFNEGEEGPEVKQAVPSNMGVLISGDILIGHQQFRPFKNIDNFFHELLSSWDEDTIRLRFLRNGTPARLDVPIKTFRGE